MYRKLPPYHFQGRKYRTVTGFLDAALRFYGDVADSVTIADKHLVIRYAGTMRARFPMAYLPDRIEVSRTEAQS